MPGVRSLDSHPARMHGMPLPRFVVATAAGSLPWCCSLTWLGDRMRENFGRGGQHIVMLGEVVRGAVPVVYACRA